MNSRMARVISDAIEATEAYLEILDTQGRGRERSPVELVPGRPPEFRSVGGVPCVCGLYRGRPRLRLLAGDGVTYVADRQPEKIEAGVVEYDRRTGEILLAFTAKDLPPSPGAIETDMRWLVRQQLLWLQERGDKMQSPFGSEVKAKLLDDSSAREFVARMRADCTESQREAVGTAIRHPLTYVWGPPGTGKTTKVLSELLQGFLRKGMRVLVAGPTNTAIDNALLAVLRRLSPDEEAMTLPLIARLGLATPDLLKEYPGICEDDAIQKELSAIVDELEGIEGELETVVRVGRAKRRIEQLETSLRGMRAREESLYALVRGEEARQPALLGIVESAQARLSELEGSLSRAEEQLSRLGFWARNFTDKRALAMAEVARCRKLVEEARRIQRDADLDYGRHALVLESATRDLHTLAEEAHAATTERESKIATLQLDAFMGKDLDVEQLRELHRSLSSKKARLAARKETLKFSLEGKRVLVTTLDTFASRFRNEGPSIDWVIVDEAAFAPVIKTFPLLSLSCPITLLGDHKQLGPIVEADKTDERINRFWRRGSVDLHDTLSNESTSGPTRAELRETFRFSEELASVLRKHVYKRPLQGMSPHSTRVFRVEIRARPDAARTRRVNQAEVEVVARLVEQERARGITSLAVLTPYKSQVSAIHRLLDQRGLLEEIDVLNVHRSQGREWDTVIFSVVDGSLEGCRPHFTTSRKDSGRLTLNSALSRVRERLFVVCEGGFWRHRSEELLADLLAQAEPFDV